MRFVGTSGACGLEEFEGKKNLQLRNLKQIFRNFEEFAAKKNPLRNCAEYCLLYFLNLNDQGFFWVGFPYNSPQFNVTTRWEKVVTLPETNSKRT